MRAQQDTQSMQRLRRFHSVAREGERLGISTALSGLPHDQQQYLKNRSSGGEGSDPHDPTIGVVFAIILTPWPEDEFCEADLKCVVGKLDTEFGFMCGGNSAAGANVVGEAMQMSMFERNNSPAINRYNMLMRTHSTILHGLGMRCGLGDHPDSKEFAELRNKVFMDVVNAHAKYKGQGQAADDDGDSEH